MSESEEFEPIRRHVRRLQNLLASQEKQALKTRDALVEALHRYELTPTEYGLRMDQLRVHLERTEYEIIRAKSHLPPFAEIRQGVMWLQPVTARIDPRSPA